MSNKNTSLTTWTPSKIAAGKKAVIDAFNAYGATAADAAGKLYDADRRLAIVLADSRRSKLYTECGYKSFNDFAVALSKGTAMEESFANNRSAATTYANAGDALNAFPQLAESTTGIQAMANLYAESKKSDERRAETESFIDNALSENGAITQAATKAFRDSAPSTPKTVKMYDYVPVPFAYAGERDLTNIPRFEHERVLGKYTDDSDVVARWDENSAGYIECAELLIRKLHVTVKTKAKVQNIAFTPEMLDRAAEMKLAGDKRTMADILKEMVGA